MLKAFVSFIVFVGVLILCIFVLSPRFHLLLQTAGFEKEEVMISGTGSMYPTFPKGSSDNDIARSSEIVAWPKMRRYPAGFTVFGTTWFAYQLQRGDIVEFENTTTDTISKEKYGKEAGFVKRLIGLPGDTIELRDGYLYRNNERVDEPYTATPRSTYGGDVVSDCTALTVPGGKAFVLGDNRKASLDSRFSLGLVNLADLHYVLPITEQDEYKKNWRDTSHDTSFAHTVTFDPAQFITLLNQKRVEKKLKPLVYKSLLSDSAKQRGKTMIASGDLGKGKDPSAATLRSSIESAGYHNILYAEVFTRGFFQADELLENVLTFADTSKLFLTNDYQDFGIAPVLGNVNNCPVQLVVAHFGGYEPPVYTKTEKESWQKMKDNIDEVLPTWEQLKDADGVDQTKLNILLDILRTRKQTAEKVLARITANQWLTAEEKKMVDTDNNRAQEAEKIIDQLSSQK